MAFRCSTRGQITKLMNVEAMFAVCEASDRALNPCAPRNCGESYRTVDAAFENSNCGGDFCKEARKRCEQCEFVHKLNFQITFLSQKQK